MNANSHTSNGRVRARAVRGHFARRSRHPQSLGFEGRKAIERDVAETSCTTTGVIVRVYNYGFFWLSVAVNHVLGVRAVARVQFDDVISSHKREGGEITAVVRSIDLVVGPPIEQGYQAKTRISFSLHGRLPRINPNSPRSGRGGMFEDGGRWVGTLIDRSLMEK